LGVMELIMTRQKLNFTSEINNICTSLQKVNLRSTEVSSIPRTKVSSTMDSTLMYHSFEFWFH